MNDTKYYNTITPFKKNITKHLLFINKKVEYIREVLTMIDEVGDRELFYNWCNGIGSTLELRKSFENTKFNYWKSLSASNMIDELDNYSCIY